MRALVLTVLLAACGETVDLPLPADYTSWGHIEVSGEVPGHGNTFRIIYANPLATDPTQPRYQEGSMLIKEIYDREGGTLKTIEAMRRDGDGVPALQNEGDWLYATIGRDGTATHKDLCWNRCHVAAPYNGAWYDYRGL